MPSVLAEIWTEYLPDESFKHSYFTNLFRVSIILQMYYNFVLEPLETGCDFGIVWSIFRMDIT